MEHLQSLHTRMNEQTRTQSELVRRDALRDHPVAIGTATTPPVDAPYMLASEFVPASQRGEIRIAERCATQPPSVGHLSDVAAASAPLEDGTDCPLEYDMEDKYDDIAVSVSLTYVAFTSHASSVDDLSD
jgi:hypothetical protein